MFSPALPAADRIGTKEKMNNKKWDWSNKIQSHVNKHQNEKENYIHKKMSKFNWKLSLYWARVLFLFHFWSFRNLIFIFL
jgi:hypothetical protein